MKMYFRIDGQNETREATLTGNMTKEKALKKFSEKYGKPCYEVKKKSVNLLTDEGIFSVWFFVALGEKITGKRLFSDFKELPKGKVWYLGNVSLNKADHASEIVYNHMINSGDDDMNEAMQRVYEELGIKGQLVTDDTVIIKG